MSYPWFPFVHLPAPLEPSNPWVPALQKDSCRTKGRTTAGASRGHPTSLLGFTETADLPETTTAEALVVCHIATGGSCVGILGGTAFLAVWASVHPERLGVLP